jgi:hypothetical protein
MQLNQLIRWEVSSEGAECPSQLATGSTAITIVIAIPYNHMMPYGLVRVLCHAVRHPCEQACQYHNNTVDTDHDNCLEASILHDVQIAR